MVVTTDTPVRVLTTKSKGWRNITAWTHDPGEPPYEAELRFNGTTYPLSPRMPVGNSAKGKVVIPSPEAASPLR